MLMWKVGLCNHLYFSRSKLIHHLKRIESVSLIIDGVFDQDLVETEDVNGSYHFSWIPQEAKLHTLGAIVRDVAGNVVSTPESTFYVENYSDAGLAISLREKTTTRLNPMVF